jgi:hypothetical protein
MGSGKVAKWWLSDDVLMLEEPPHTVTGRLKQARAAGELPGPFGGQREGVSLGEAPAAA